jgi:N-acyl homoserine lactone hydrolase
MRSPYWWHRYRVLPRMMRRAVEHALMSCASLRRRVEYFQGWYAKVCLEKPMKLFLPLLVLAVGIGTWDAAALAQGTPEVALTRLECGTPQAPTDVNARFSDTYAFPGVKLQFVYSCYLIKHGSDYMMWDTGQSTAAGAVAPKVGLVDWPRQRWRPSKSKYIGISHFHGDHIGQANALPKATLLIGKGDWDVLTSAKPPANINPQLLSNWISGGGPVEPVPQDKDVFGDGTVVMLSTPGHTPGHHSLLVKLAQTGPVLLSGDAIHFRENYEGRGVPIFNFDRSQTLASIDRIKTIAENLKATLVIQHDARDVAKLPAFPEAAK